MDNLLKTIGNLAAGAIIASFIGQGQSLLVLVSIGVLSILFSIHGYKWLTNSFDYLKKKYHARRSTVCIHAGISTQGTSLEDKWINESLEEVVKTITKVTRNMVVNYDYELPVNYPVVVNPNGSSYSETQLDGLNELDKIFKYVSQGGVYINISNIPFYAAYSGALGVRIDTTPPASPFTLKPSFFETPIAKRIGVYPVGPTDGTVHRRFSLPPNATPLSTVEETSVQVGKDLEVFDVSDMLLVKYGKGCFIFSGKKYGESTMEELVLHAFSWMKARQVLRKRR